MISSGRQGHDCPGRGQHGIRIQVGLLNLLAISVDQFFPQFGLLGRDRAIFGYPAVVDFGDELAVVSGKFDVLQHPIPVIFTRFHSVIVAYR